MLNPLKQISVSGGPQHIVPGPTKSTDLSRTDFTSALSKMVSSSIDDVKEEPASHILDRELKISLIFPWIMLRERSLVS